jgi:hypothetical protein
MDSYGAETLRVANQVLVTIAVKGNKLSVYPRRTGDVRAYFRKENHSPDKPVEIRWAVTGLGNGQTIRITSKEGVQPVFPGEPYQITYPENTICSQSPVKGPATRHGVLTWRYDITLLENGRALDVLDPDVEIKEDP